ncbi:MAG TPA: Mpo1-like protein [Gemmataceae bacterium]|nr:Mpo1-like protein [Gemmataceae bacterium]
MKSLAEQLDAYAAYHADPRNKLTHFVGVPLVSFALFLALGWLRFVHAPEAPCTGATLFYLVVFLYYLRLDWRLALCQLPFTLPLWWLADRVALWPWRDSVLVFLATFLGGWVVQLLGHGLEGRRPALADNLLQVFNAPLFLAAEVALLLGLRQDLRGAVGWKQASGAEPGPRAAGQLERPLPVGPGREIDPPQ